VHLADVKKVLNSYSIDVSAHEAQDLAEEPIVNRLRKVSSLNASSRNHPRFDMTARLGVLATMAYDPAINLSCLSCFPFAIRDEFYISFGHRLPEPTRIQYISNGQLRATCSYFQNHCRTHSPHGLRLARIAWMRAPFSFHCVSHGLLIAYDKHMSVSGKMRLNWDANCSHRCVCLVSWF
jgi:hypothetical protein